MVGVGFNIDLFSESCSISALSCSFEFVVGGGWVGGGGSQRLLSLINLTTVLVVLLLGLTLGCDKSQRYKRGEHMDRLTHRLTNARSENTRTGTDECFDRQTHG